eukprot:3461573-Prymnesium_polylepis.1
MEIIKHEGVLALYKGTGPRMARVCCEVAITMTLYGEGARRHRRPPTLSAWPQPSVPGPNPQPGPQQSRLTRLCACACVRVC